MIVALIFFSSSADLTGGGSTEDIVQSFEEGMAHTEKKNEEKARSSRSWKHSIPVKKRWTDSKWFWHIIALGIVQPKNGRIVVNWRNLLAAFVLLTVLKFAILDQL